MATEEQILRFIIDMQTKSFKTGLEDVKEGLDKVVDSAEEAAKKSESEGGEGLPGKILPKKGTKRTKQELKLLRGGVDLLKKGLDFLADTAKTWAKEWGDFYLNMETFRKETGMNRAEIKEFRIDVLRASADFGVAMEKTAAIARAIARGSMKARREIADLAAAQAFAAKATGMSEQTAADQAFQLDRVLQLSAELSKKIPLVTAFMAKHARVDTDSVVKMRVEHENLLLRMQREGQLSAEEAIKRLDSFIASLFQGGARIEDVSAVLGEMGKRESQLFKKMAEHGFDLQNTLDFMKEQWEKFNKGLIGSQEGLFKVLGQSAESAVRAAARAQEFYQGNLLAFQKALEMSQTALEKWAKHNMSWTERVGMSWTKLKNSITATAEELTMTREEWGRSLSIMAERHVGAFDLMLRGLTGRKGGFEGGKARRFKPEEITPVNMEPPGFFEMMFGDPMARVRKERERLNLLKRHSAKGWPNAPVPNAPVPEAMRTDVLKSEEESRRLQKEQMEKTDTTNTLLKSWLELQERMERDPRARAFPGRGVRVPDYAAARSGRK